MRHTPENTSFSDSSPPALAELDWQAFCYLSNELNETDRLAFEARLENDHAACEAVARAVELSSSIRAAEVMTPVVCKTNASHAWQMRLSWLAVGAGIAGALMALISGATWLVPQTLMSTVIPAPAAVEQESVSTALAVAWSESMPGAVNDTLVEPDEQVASAAAQRPELAVPLGDLSSDDLPPSWMLAAVRGLAESEAELNMSEPVAEDDELILQ